MDLGPIFLTTDTSVYGREMAMSLTSPPIPSLQMLCVDNLMRMLCDQDDDDEISEYLAAILGFSLPGEIRQRIIYFLAMKKRLTKSLFDMVSGMDVASLKFAGADLSDVEDSFFENVWDIVSGIESFDFSGAEISAPIFRMLVSANIQNPPTVKKVLHLNFSNSEGMTDYLIGVICCCFSNLETLNISNCQLLSPDALSAIATSTFAATLKNLDISYNSASPPTLAMLESLENLESLNMSFLVETGSAFLRTSNMRSLRRLDLSALHQLEDGCIEFMLIRPNVVSDSTGCNQVERESLLVIQQLEELRLTESYLSPESFLRIFTCSSSTNLRAHSRLPPQPLLLQVLDLSWTENITAAALTDGVKLCPLLQTLLLRSTRADNSTVVAAAEHCPYLTELNVSRCDGINDVSLNELVLLNNLQSLDLSWASIQNASTINFLKTSSSLRVLSVQGCKGLEANVVEVLINGAVPKLKFIDLGWVNMFSSTLASELSSKRPDLIVVDYYMQVYVGGVVVADRI